MSKDSLSAAVDNGVMLSLPKTERNTSLMAKKEKKDTGFDVLD